MSQSQRGFLPHTLALMMTMPVAALANDNNSTTVFQLDEIAISKRRSGGFETYRIDPLNAPESSGDPSRLMRGVPGGNFNSNGPLAGQIQYRGMFGPRVNTRINGMYINSGGPNLMDPPTHYAPRSQVASFEVHRGLSPVSAGPEAIGGTVNIQTRMSRFTNSDAFNTQGSVQSGFQSVNDGINGGAMLGMANSTHRFHMIGGGATSNDTRFDSSDDLAIQPTEQDRTYTGIGYGFRQQGHEISLDYRHFDTDDVGNPSLPQDTGFMKTDLVNSTYSGEFGAVELKGRLSYSDIEHGMNNFRLRQPPNTFGPPLGADQSMAPAPFQGRDRRFVRAESDGLGGALSATTPVPGGDVTWGSDFHLAEHNVRVFDPDSMFFAESFNNIQRDRFSVFGEWQTSLGADSRMTSGLRYTRVEMEAGKGTAPGLPPAQNLEQAFNSRDRDRDEDLVDLVVEIEHRLNGNATVELGLGRKSRAPSYIERFAWIPIEATAGLGDGNNHVGNLNLDPEVSHELELGLEWQSSTAYFTPRVFYRNVDDYIQGTPVPNSEMNLIMVSRVNGDEQPLRYNNVEAELFGADAGLGYRLSNAWRGDATISYVRGRRDDIDDDLFRIAPLNGTLSVSYEVGDWQLTAQNVWAASQDHVSRTNGEPESDGYAIYNLMARWQAFAGLSVTLGVENLLDDRYEDHLAGFNRVAASDVGGQTAPPTTEGNRIPGPGRNLLARFKYSW